MLPFEQRGSSAQCVGPRRAHEASGANGEAWCPEAMVGGLRTGTYVQTGVCTVPGVDGGDFAHWGHRFGGGLYSDSRPQCTKSLSNGVASVQSRPPREGQCTKPDFAHWDVRPDGGLYGARRPHTMAPDRNSGGRFAGADPRIVQEYPLPANLFWSDAQHDHVLLHKRIGAHEEHAAVHGRL